MELTKRTARLAAVAVLGLLGIATGSSLVQAAEGGHGVYLLGLKGPASGIIPPPGVFLTNTGYWYEGSN